MNGDDGLLSFSMSRSRARTLSLLTSQATKASDSHFSSRIVIEVNNVDLCGRREIANAVAEGVSY